MTDLDTRSAALKACSMLCSDASKPTASSTLQALTELAIKLYLERNREALGEFAENILPVILDRKEKFMAFIQPYSRSCHESGSRMALFIAILKVGRAKSILTDSEALDLFASAFPPPAPPFSYETKSLYWCRQVLMSADYEVRILTYGLLVSSPATNAIVLPETLECIATSMRYLHDDAAAHERGEILSITKRLLRRLQGSIPTLRKSTQLPPYVNDVQAVLDSYSSFTKSFYAFLKDELNTGVSYPRHILGLLSLQCLLDLSLDPGMFAGDDGLLKALTCLVLDPFEDVRSTAAAVLQTLIVEDGSLVNLAIDHILLKRVEALAVRTLRADHADGMGRLCALKSRYSSPKGRQPDLHETELVKDVCFLKQSTTGEGDIQLRPGCVIPIHALLLATSYRLRCLDRQDEQITYIGPTIIKVCENVWEQVRLRLCVDSPETASEAEDEITSEGPKDLLAYSWRALRDSSLVLQSLILVAAPSRELFSAVGDLCMDQLISLRHRGAFSTVAQTFSQCCDKVRLSFDPAICGLIHKWYQVALSQITEQASRLTRRSAGLPAMIGALLNPSDSIEFSSSINDLMIIAERGTDRISILDIEDVKLPQVHALNCLKDIMTNSKFAVVVVQHLERMMELAATCLSSKVWAIRNCGLMLLRACINRLDSSSMGARAAPVDRSTEQETSYTTSTIAFRLFNAPAFETDKAANSKASDTELVFAGLDLLGHAAFKGSEADEAAERIMEYLTHSTWAVRDHAALLLATRLLGGNPAGVIMKLLQDIGVSGSENQVHGVLLCCRYLFGRATVLITSAELESIIECLINQMIRSDGDLSSHSPYVYAAWLDLLNDAFSYVLENRWTCGLSGIQRLQGLLPSAARVESTHYSYLSRRMLLCKTYHFLLRDAPLVHESEELQDLASQYVEDVDALGFVFDVVGQKHCHKPSRNLVNLLICLIDDGSRSSSLPPAILEQIFTCLAQCLDHITDISIHILRELFCALSLSQLHTTRDLRNAALKLQASLLGRIQTAHVESFPHAQQIEVWLDAIQDIATDYLDFPTRLSAVTAISTFIEHLKSHGTLELPSSLRIHLLLVLYDLLNDDDEEIRLEAIHAARKLRLHEPSAMNSLGSSALSARENLLSELSRQFGRTSKLTEAAIVNILRIGQNTNDSIPRAGAGSLFNTSFFSRLQSISRSKNDLFAEERQNLYMDDIREIKEWTEVLYNGNGVSTAQELWKSAMNWTLEGLSQVLMLLEAEHTTTLGHRTSTHDGDERQHQQTPPQDGLLESLFVHPLGLTYDHAILVLMIQVVSLSGVFIHHDKGVETQQQRASLEKIKGICLDSQANPAMLVQNIQPDTNSRTDSLCNSIIFVLALAHAYRILLGSMTFALKHLAESSNIIPSSFRARSYSNLRPVVPGKMNAGLAILICFVVITPVCVWAGWKIFMPMMQEHMAMMEEGERRREAGHPQAVGAG
ncbi:hypothetical protein AYL99_06753 [Fonsecaea erecta]|uniref:Uncharacterized protein n=1 Tax=Fonsecaea erecta TaxID=1367422 RepID=A0A178ZK94_9EURO|nr:hypothetical protein AYL99_06753 [Fonsecaea erecta]OAP59455.1 hypothetical protein AYL99_06753 [Fonsecaea erecta]